MGVQGLTSFIERQPQLYREIQFREDRLVIDGANLNYVLYFNSGLDQNHGGEYAAFENVIEKFFTALKECNISPYVVLDGGAGNTDIKLDTLIQRAEDRIQKAHRAALGGQENIIPQLYKPMFKQTLMRLKVPVAMCFGEADREIAALAKEWQCPVLSSDSDFYIFNLPAGLLPMSHFKWGAQQQRGSQKSIPCKHYKSSSFCSFFNIQPQVLPVFAVLSGNDYVKTESLTYQFAPRGGKGARMNGLLRWLKKFRQPEEALLALQGLLGNLSPEEKASLRVGLEEYQLPPSCLRAFFTDGTVPPLPAGEQVGVQVPDWMRLPVTKAQLSGDVLDILVLQRMSPGFPVESAALPSANLTSRPLRQLMYGLLLGPGQKVEEMDRDGYRLTRVMVQAAVTEDTEQLPLPSLHKVAASRRLQALLGALGVSEECLSCVPPEWRLPMAVTCYWLKRAEPRPEEKLLKALLMTMSHGYDPNYRQNSSTHRTGRLDVGVAHSFNQWQACLKDCVHLNQLLGFPLPDPHIARLYQGTLVHWMVQKMTPGNRLPPVLKYDPESIKLYNLLLEVVNRFQNQEAPTSSKTKVTAKPPQQPSVDDLTADLQQLFLHH